MVLEKYSITYYIKLKEKPFTSTNISKPIHFPPSKDVHETELYLFDNCKKAVISLEAEDEEKAIQKAKGSLERMIYSFVLSTNVGLEIEEQLYDISSINKMSELPYSNNKVVSDMGHFIDEARREFTSFDKECLDYMYEIYNALDRLVDKSDAFHYCFKWYNRGLIETNHIDMFVSYYIALEILGAYYYSSDTFTARVQKIINDSEIDLEGKYVTDLRGALSHWGMKENEVVR
ncbi:MAG: hypothetical protein ABSB40_11525 [Nitrososphaeria archaeon]|jgi:hypothetical protein